MKDSDIKLALADLEHLESYGVSRGIDAFQSTIGDPEWLKIHESDLRNLLPETWTHMDNLNALKIGYGLKLLGIDWRTRLEFGTVMVFLENIGILQRENFFLIRANHLSIFQ